MSSERFVWMNGDFISEKDAKLSIYDSALMFGDMVFEMTRSFNKNQFKLKEHLDRLYASIKYVHIDIELSINDMEAIVYETIERNEPAFQEDDEHRIMINVSRGILSIYEEVIGLKKGPNIIIADFPLKWTVSGMGHLFDEGINAVIPKQRAIPSELLNPKVKSRSRLHYLMANIEASMMKGNNNWALLLDTDGNIAEGTGDNFFIVADDILVTPKPKNILKGVSRKYIFELAKELNIECQEKDIDKYDVLNAQEAFMTGTPFCMLPVTKIDGIDIGDGKVGIVFSKLLNQWSENVGVNIKKQIQHWNRKISSDSVTPYSFKNK